MNVAILLSGGTGTRINSSIPKQYIDVKGKMIIEYSLEAIKESNIFQGLVIVADQAYHAKLKEITANFNMEVELVLPGNTRQLSIYNGLLSGVAKKSDVVFIHDAARPNITPLLINQYVTAIEGYDGVLPVLPMKDTVYQVRDGVITGLLKREEIFAGQAPEVFVYKKYMDANERLMPDDIYKINGSSEPAFLYGMNIVTIKGDENNYKITTDADLEKFKNQ